MITFQIERWEQYYRDCQDLWREHYEEIARDKERMEMRPNVGYFAAIEQVGGLQILTAREGGKLVGYMITAIHPHSHYSGVLCGFEDAYFLSAPYRKGMTGIRLIKESLEHLKWRGVKKVFFHTKKFKNLGRIFEYLGFEQTDIIYAKWIGT